MTDRVDTLFDEYAARWARGERPDAGDYLEQAGEERDDLALLIDRYLSVAPAQEPDEVTLRFMERLEAGDPPLLAARVARGQPRSRLVAFLLQAFALPADREEKVETYWHELESGRRSPAQVTPELWRRVVEFLGPTAESARGWRPSAPETGVAYLRSQDADFPFPSAPAPAAEEPAEPDEVDRLFGYAP